MGSPESSTSSQSNSFQKTPARRVTFSSDAAEPQNGSTDSEEKSTSEDVRITADNLTLDLLIGLGRRVLNIRGREYTLVSGINFWHLSFKNLEPVRDLLQRVSKQNGEEVFSCFKLHISVRDDDYGMVKKAFDIVIQSAFFRFGFWPPEVKVVKEGVEIGAKKWVQHGKQITFQIGATLGQQGSLPLNAFITHVTEKLIEQRIFPGPLAPYDNTVPGSEFFSYRNETNEHGVNVAASKARGVSPVAGIPDIIAEHVGTINVSGQPLRPALPPEPEQTANNASRVCPCAIL